MFWNKQSGNVLLLALLVMAGIMTAGLGIGTIILNEIKQARNIDFSTVAYFAAESGVEQAIYKLRKEDAVINCPVGVCGANGFCSGGEGESCITAAGDLSNDASWERTIVDREPQIYGKIEKDNSMQIDLFDPENAVAAGVESVKIEWVPDCVAPAVSTIEVGYVNWDPIAGWSEATEKKFKYTALESPVINNGFSGTKSYRLRIKALYCDINNVIITVWGADNAVPPQVKIPARIVLNSAGEYGVARQAIKVTMPRKSPMSGLYDYVLFSECSLVKGDDAVCP
ncbi:hypothetical protein KKD80_03025 [Patescibacteria group bacterium]|nr:hypothetical protein [Patescibacteria group bacterium]